MIKQSLHIPARHAGFAKFMAHNLARVAKRLFAQRQINFTRFRARMSKRNGVIRLCHAPRFKQHAQLPVTLRVKRHDNQSTGVLIQPMHITRAGKNSGYARGQAIRVVRANARNRKQPGGFVEHHKIILGVDHSKAVM